MRGWERHLWVLALLAAAALALPGAASAAIAGSVEALNEPAGLYSEERHFWSPERVSLTGSGTVTFSNKSASIPHGVYWTSATHPVCEEGAGKVPVGFSKSGVSWSGSCSFAKSGAYTYYCTVHGPAMSGTIDVAGTPEAATEAAGEATQTSATLRGSVKPEGNATEYRFEYGTASVSEHATPTLALAAEDFSSHGVSAAVSGLSAGTTYRVRLVVVYGEAHTTLHGSERELTTPTALAPSVKASLPNPLGETEATLKGTVDPEGEATKYFFEYGLSEAKYLATEPVTLPADGATHLVSVLVKGLLPATEYSFRLVAENGTGQTKATGTFKTASPPPPPPPPPTPTPAPVPPSPEPSVPLLTQPVPSEPGPSFGPALIAGSLRLGGHGSALRGSIGIGLSGVGGRLEVDLLARPSALGAHGSKPVVVGRFLRTSVAGGTLSFSLSLQPRARAALRRRGRLALTARVTLTPTEGRVARLTRTLALRA